MIDITFIGTGALMPIPDRALISIFLRHMGTCCGLRPRGNTPHTRT